MASIFYTNYYISDELYKIEDVFCHHPEFKLPKRFKTSEIFLKLLRKTTGVNSLSIINKPLIEICSQLMSDFLTKTKINPLDIYYLIGDKDDTYYTKDDIGILYYLQKKYGLDNATVINIDAYRAGSIVSMAFISSLLNEKKYKYGVIFSTCLSTDINDRIPSGNAWIVGDGVGITVISKEPSHYEIIDFESRSFGDRSYVAYNKLDQLFNPLSMIKKGVDLFKFLLNNNNLHMIDIYMVIPQNIGLNSYINVYPKIINLSPNQIFTQNISHGGYLGNVDFARNLKDFGSTHSPPKGAYIVLHGTSADCGGESNHFMLLQYKGK